MQSDFFFFSQWFSNEEWLLIIEVSCYYTLIDRWRLKYRITRANVILENFIFNFWKNHESWKEGFQKTPPRVKKTDSTFDRQRKLADKNVDKTHTACGSRGRSGGPSLRRARIPLHFLRYENFGKLYLASPPLRSLFRWVKRLDCSISYRVGGERLLY